MPDYPLAQFRVPENIRDAMAARLDGRSLGQQAARDLERYYEALARELRTIELTEREASLICDALNGSLLDVSSAALIWAEVSDGVRYNQLDQKWLAEDRGAGAGAHFAAEQLIEKLRSLTYTQSLALADAVERFWSAGSIANTGDQLRAVGLLRD